MKGKPVDPRICSSAVVLSLVVFNMGNFGENNYENPVYISRLPWIVSSRVYRATLS